MSEVAIVSHDAGGAEILASFVRRQHLNCLFAVQGPASRVFERRLGPVQTRSMHEAVGACDWLLTGTSWQSDIEWQAIGLARTAGKRSVAFLDHWSNFRERFVRNGEQHLPDEIWVGDEFAQRIAQDCFPGHTIQLVPNPFFDDLRDEIAGMRTRQASAEGIDALFVSEPLHAHGLQGFGSENHWGYSEFDALRYFLSNVAALGTPVRSVTVRPHPSEPPGKYDWVSSEFGPHVQPGGKRSLLEEVADSDLVVGCESMAMIVGLVAGRRVVCCIPPGGKPCALPHTQIESLQKLVVAAGTA